MVDTVYSNGPVIHPILLDINLEPVLGSRVTWYTPKVSLTRDDSDEDAAFGVATIMTLISFLCYT